MKKHKFLFTLLFLVLTAITGFLIGWFTDKPVPDIVYTETTEVPCEITEQRGGGYTFINPLLECDNYQPSQLNSVVQMQNKIESYIRSTQNSNKANFISVYFRDLNFGPWLGINEKENFSPASLLKVPVMIAAFKKAEKDTSFLKRKVKYIKHFDEEIEVRKIIYSNQLQLGNTYTIENLVELMITNSDNEAQTLLVKNLDNSLITQVMNDIGVNTSRDMTKDFVSVKEYSGFFRLLYNATYLNRNMSEKALGILTKMCFNNGIVAGVPKGTVVAHKFGERTYTDSAITQLHDCGIVYAPGSPYLLCIMTRGNDSNKLQTIISDISALVYNEVVKPK